MPTPHQYINEFRLTKYSYLNGYFLDDITVGHDVITRYKEYEYPTRMVWKVSDTTADQNSFIANLIEYLSPNKIIYTQYGNPYSCNFGTLSFYTNNPNEILVTSTGNCRRIYN